MSPRVYDGSMSLITKLRPYTSWWLAEPRTNTFSPLWMSRWVALQNLRRSASKVLRHIMARILARMPPRSSFSTSSM